MPKSEGDSGVKPGQILEIEVQLLDIRKAHKKHINVAQLHCLILQKLAMPNLEGDSEVKRDQIFNIAVWLLDICKAHKNHINIV